MDIARLNELKRLITSSYTLREEFGNQLSDEGTDLLALIDSAMQPVSSEVERAIKYFQNSQQEYIPGCDCGVCREAKPFIDLAIRALQAYKGE